MVIWVRRAWSSRHPQDANLSPERLGDFDLLPLADRQAAQQSPGVEIELKVFKQPSRPPVDRSPVNPGADPWLVPQRQVLGDGERLDQVQLLVDDADPCRQRGGGVAEPDRLAADLDPARVRTENAAQDLDERALAGAILAAECRISASQFESHLVQSPACGESL